MPLARRKKSAKRCAGPCQTVWSMQDFAKSKRAHDGHQSWCRACISEYHNWWWQEFGKAKRSIRAGDMPMSGRVSTFDVHPTYGKYSPHQRAARRSIPRLRRAGRMLK